MNEKEITALAREYAEIACPEFKYKGDKEWRKDDIKSETLSNEAFLTWLLLRHRLVEKDRVEDIYKSILVQLDPKNFGYSAYNQGRKELLESLFPDLGKEVER